MHWLSKKLKSNQGFTMVELIVVIVILGIIFMVGMDGMIKWQRYSAFKRNEEYAQTLFAAAQAALVDDKSVEKFLKEPQSMHAGIVPKSVSEPAGGGRQLYYLDIKRGERLDQNQPLYTLLKPYVTDPGIFNAAIRLEFDPLDRLVYSLSYCEKAESFDYSDAQGSGHPGIVGLGRNNRIKDQRRKMMMGYYGTTLPKPMDPPAEKLGLGKVNLVNGEALVLQIGFPSQEEQLDLEEFTYMVDLYDGTGERRCSFTLNENGLDFKRLTESPQAFPAQVTYYEAGGFRKENNVPVAVSVNKEDQVCVILDAVDLKAAKELDQMLRSEETTSLQLADMAKDTYSILRFGIKPGSRMKAAVHISAQNRISQIKNTGECDPLLGNPASNTKAWQIKNARHLFNIRFLEYYAGGAESSSYGYLQMGDIIWNGSGGIVEKGLVYQEQTVVAGKTADFIPIFQLNQGSFYQAGEESGSRGQIKGLKIRQRQQCPKELTLSQGEKYAVGLFRVNRGTIARLQITDVLVEGADYVGAVCGINYGELTDIKVQQSKEAVGSSYVKGRDYVGGIAGADSLNFEGARVYQKSASYTRLINEISIMGRACVGGIIGYSALGKDEESPGNDGTSYLIRACINAGVISADGSAGYDVTAYRYFGGIVGYKNEGTLLDCTSETRGRSLDDIDPQAPRLGDYVGGIAGYALGTKIHGCSTGRGVFSGRNYVGGIVGFWGILREVSGEEVLLTELNGKSGQFADSGGTNRLILVGEHYVGGITGASARQNSDGTLSQEALTGEVEVMISNWNNQGLAIASKNYAGGISGYNTGILNNCSSQMEAFAADMGSVRGNTGDFNGGLAGYNNGLLQADRPMEIRAFVVGRDYTGGLVGYNDLAGEISGKYYRLTAGSVLGDRYVGGLIGLNVSAALFADEIAGSEVQVWSADPDEVAGRMFVGGVIGANIIAPDSHKFLQSITNNSKGRVTAEIGFAGGHIGYQLMAAVPGQIFQVLDKINQILSQGDGGEKSMAEQVMEIAPEEASGCRLTIVQAVNHLSVSTGLFAGGLVGYHGPGSALIITGGENRAEVTGNKAVPFNRKDNISEVADTLLYAYIGGIIGLVGQDVTISGCRTSGKIHSAATFTGGVTEVNQGLIAQCRVESYQEADCFYAGGLTGLNQGVIENCEVVGVVAGRSAAGGAAAYNSGSIAGCQVFSQVLAAEGIAGGAVAFNAATGRIAGGLVSSQEGIKPHIGGATYAGGIVGINKGKVSQVGVTKLTISGAPGQIGKAAGYHSGEIDRIWVTDISLLPPPADAQFDGLVGENSGTITG